MEEFARGGRFSRVGYTHPPATMQKNEKKRVAGGASWKLLKLKGQICSGRCEKAVTTSESRPTLGRIVPTSYDAAA